MQKSTTNFDEKFKVNDLQHEAAGMRGEPECLTLTSSRPVRHVVKSPVR